MRTVRQRHDGESSFAYALFKEPIDGGDADAFVEQRVMNLLCRQWTACTGKQAVDVTSVYGTARHTQMIMIYHYQSSRLILAKSDELPTTDRKLLSWCACLYASGATSCPGGRVQTGDIGTSRSETWVTHF